MRLLPAERFAPIFEPLRGKRMGYVTLPGNFGDKLIEMATFQLLELFGVNYYIQGTSEECTADELLVAGGGNMGTLWEAARSVRMKAIAFGKPVTVLPQSFNAPENLNYHRVYVREENSLRFRSDAVLAPDLALGLDYSSATEPSEPLGIWLRKDKEALFAGHSTGDPIRACKTVQEYIDLAGTYSCLVTDRLHLAICGLLQKRAVTLLPNSYHKNRSMWETWLQDLGCAWSDALAVELLGRSALRLPAPVNGESTQVRSVSRDSMT